MAKTGYYYSAAVAFLFLHCAAAQTEHFVWDAALRTVHVVGEANHWGIPPNPNFYSTWANSRTFYKNDVLSFYSSKGKQDVKEVPKEAYEACSTVNDLGGKIANFLPSNYTLNETGFHYFISTIGDQCNMGQKLAVNVLSDLSTPSTPSSAAPRALVAAGSFLITLSFVLGKLVL
ncbi:hypothetical protein QN277_024320 [Acacia crassicarpa]|uniref:Phytocyanin domain-containing protein n=1 Tax=Acacia crassicarpa TaxID=499986 RepID=A0AAE1JFI4_9FABA|nr:hypothetical protein QN277_024320 [Acacia crassicarpa]